MSSNCLLFKGLKTQSANMKRCGCLSKAHLDFESCLIYRQCRLVLKGVLKWSGCPWFLYLQWWTYLDFKWHNYFNPLIQSWVPLFIIVKHFNLMCFQENFSCIFSPLALQLVSRKCKFDEKNTFFKHKHQVVWKQVSQHHLFLLEAQLHSQKTFTEYNYI